MKTQGTELFFIDPDSEEVVQVACVTSITGIDAQKEQIEITCLEDLARSFMAGLATPGTANFGIYTEPQEPSHARLHELFVEGETLQWAVGWSDDRGTVPETTTDTNGDPIFDLQDTRSWLTFEGFINSFPFDFQQNAAVASNLGIQISGMPVLVPRTNS